MNYAKITFPDKRGEHFIGISNFQIFMSRPDLLSIQHLDKDKTYHFDDIRIRKITIQHWLIIEFSGYLYNMKKYAFERINGEIKIDDVKELANLINKKRHE